MNDNVRKLKIGDIEIKNNVFLAPMAGVTDLPFRYIVNMSNKYRPGLMFTEMVSSKGLVYNDAKTYRLLDIFEDGKPSAVQIFGSDVKDMVNAIERLNEIENIDIIDINMGCPAPKVTRNGDGAALLKDLKQIEKIIEACVKASNKPITIKTRRGYTDGLDTAVEVAKMAEYYGCSMITIHGRTKEQFYTGKADLEIIKRVKESVNIPVIGNGDVVDVESANRMFEYTGCDGIMVARGAMGNPWIFDEIINGESIDISPKDKLDIIFKHIDKAIEYDGEKKAVPQMRKHIAWYLKGMNGSSVVKDMINKEMDVNVVKKILKEYLKTK